MAEPIVDEQTFDTWNGILGMCDYLVASGDFVFRGHGSASWTLKSSLEREFPAGRLRSAEQQMLEHFIRHAPALAKQPDDDDDTAWLGLLQHYGGVTRLLDVSKSPYVALFFAFEAPGPQDRAIWAIDTIWCQSACATNISIAEGIAEDQARRRVVWDQRGVLDFLIGRPKTVHVPYQPFSGVFLLDPWKPDTRQIAQQAQFLCPANLNVPFMENLGSMDRAKHRLPAIWKFTFPAALRPVVLRQLVLMNVSAATLFPGFDGVARSTRTLPVEAPPVTIEATPPWAIVGPGGSRILSATPVPPAPPKP